MIARVVLFLAIAASVEGLTCNEGFNFSIAGIPLYYWEERSCLDKSKCFMQELHTEIYSTGIEVAATYGGCISTSYSDIITCQTLFGEDSTLDPTILVNMLPDFDQKLRDVSSSFRNNSNFLKEFFSNGNGRDEFIAGCYRFLENLGFNTEKAIPLKKPLTDLFEGLFYNPKTYEDYLSHQKRLQEAADKILVALGQLDTQNSDISESIYSFFGNWNTDFRNTKFAPLAENLPELIRSLLPTKLKPELWFDVIFDIMDDFRLNQPIKTSKDIVKIIKASWNMPKDEEKYVHFVLDIIPGLVDLFMTNQGSVLHDLLKETSTQTIETKRLDAAITKIIQNFNRDYPGGLSDDIKKTIELLPGLAYYFFPSKVTEINRVYDVLSDGLEALDFSNPAETMERTNMSNFILFMSEKTGLLYQVSRGQKQSKQMHDLVIINTAKVVYNLIPEYSGDLDTFFSALLKIFEVYPYFNASQLILNLGGEVPKEIGPIMDNIQNILKTIYDDSGMNFKVDEFLRELDGVIEEYKIMFPQSELPQAVENVITLVNKSLRGGPPRCPDVTDWWNDTQVYAYSRCYNTDYDQRSRFNRQILRETMNVSIEVPFAIFAALDFPGNPIFKALVDAFPDFELLFKAMRLLDPVDIKELMMKYMNWMYDGIDGRQPLRTDTLIQMLDSTLSKIVAKLDEVIKEMRVLLSPDSCVYLSCADELCNSRDAMKSEEPFTRNPMKRKFGQLPARPTEFHKEQEQQPVGNDGDASSSGKTSPAMLLHALALWILVKLFA